MPWDLLARKLSGVRCMKWTRGYVLMLGARAATAEGELFSLQTFGFLP